MCGKMSYSTREAALKDAVDLRRRIRGFYGSACRKTNHKHRPYFCELCKNWHLTTISKRLFKKLQDSRARRNARREPR